MKIIVPVILFITTNASASKRPNKSPIAQLQIYVLPKESSSSLPFTNNKGATTFYLSESLSQANRGGYDTCSKTLFAGRKKSPLFINSPIISLRGGGENVGSSSDDSLGNPSENDDQNITNDSHSIRDINETDEDGVSVIEEESIDDIPIIDNAENDSDDYPLPTSSSSAASSLLPYQYYTSIFNKDNGIFGKGKSFGRKERIVNLLYKWESDDSKKYCDMQQIDDDTDMLKDIEELESLQLRIYERAREYIEQVNEYAIKALDKGKVGTLPHPKKVLHFIAPKVPAIRGSPEIMLRIGSARARVDVSAAACALGVMGIVTEYYKCILEDLESEIGQKDKHTIQKDITSVYKDIVTDRRFEQLIECVQCGVDVEEMTEEVSDVITKKLLSVSNNEENNITESFTTLEGESSFSVEECKPLKDGISVVDAAKSIWTLAIFLSRHKVEVLGEKKCSQFIYALQQRSNHLLRNQFSHFQNGCTEQLYSDFSENLIHEIHMLLRDTISIMWASDCATQIIGNDDSFLFETCTLILNQDTKEVWDLRTSRDNDEAHEDDIVQRLAEAEDDNSGAYEIDGKDKDNDLLVEDEDENSAECEVDGNCVDNDKSYQSDDSPSHKNEVDKTSNGSPTNCFSNLFSRKTFLYEYLSPRDLTQALKTIWRLNHLGYDAHDSLSHRLLDKVNLWMDHDLDQLLSENKDLFTKTTSPDQVKLVDAASLLSTEKQLEEGKIEKSNDGNGIIDTSNLAISINDLGTVICILSGTSTVDDAISLSMQKCFDLFLSHTRSRKIENLEISYLLQLLRGSSHHANFLLNSTPKTAKSTVDFFSKITGVVFDHLNLRHDEGSSVKLLSSNELDLLVSSLHSISFALGNENDNNVIDEELIRNIFTRSMHHAIESNDGFSPNQLCQLAWIFIASHQQQTVIQDIPLDSYRVLGEIVAKVCIVFDRWQKSYDDDQSLLEYGSQPPIMFNNICALFSGLASFKLYPYELCTILSKGIQLREFDLNVSNDELIQCLYATAQMRIANLPSRVSSVHHLSKLVNLIFKVHKKKLCKSSASSSPTNFAMLVWALAIHGVKYTYEKIPCFTLDEIQSLTQPLRIQMVRKFKNIFVTMNQ